MRHSLSICLLTGLFFVLASCSNKQYQALFEQQHAIADTTAQKNTATVSTYRIKSQDILSIRNLQNIRYLVDETPSGTAASGAGGSGAGQTFQVEEDGTVTLPVIGHVAVAGLTRAEAQKQVEDLYRKNLLVNPIIELRITNLKVTMLGEIRTQGNYALTKDKTTLIELIGEAGGLTDRADGKTVKIIRGKEKTPEVIMVNLADVGEINDPRTILQSGDIVYIAQNKRAVRSDNLQSFSSIIQPALILLNTALIVFTLIHK